MFGAATPYVVAICSLLFCGACALTLFKMVDHFDPPNAEQGHRAAAPTSAPEKVAV